MLPTIMPEASQEYYNINNIYNYHGYWYSSMLYM